MTPRPSRIRPLLALLSWCVVLPSSALLVPAPVAAAQAAPAAAPLSLFERFAADHRPPENRAPEHLEACVGGMAGDYPCDHVDLLEYMPLATIGGTGSAEANDIWGWTDPLTGNEYALVGLTNGTSFVDVTDPENPIYLGRLPTHTGNSIWRDIKTYDNYAFIVSDLNGSHGMQVFDLTRLRNVPSPPATFTEDAWYNQIGSAHNIVIDEETGYAYIVGGSSAGSGNDLRGRPAHGQHPESDLPGFRGLLLRRRLHARRRVPRLPRPGQPARGPGDLLQLERGHADHRAISSTRRRSSRRSSRAPATRARATPTRGG